MPIAKTIAAGKQESSESHTRMIRSRRYGRPAHRRAGAAASQRPRVRRSRAAPARQGMGRSAADSRRRCCRSSPSSVSWGSSSRRPTAAPRCRRWTTASASRSWRASIRRCACRLPRTTVWAPRTSSCSATRRRSSSIWFRSRPDVSSPRGDSPKPRRGATRRRCRRAPFATATAGSSTAPSSSSPTEKPATSSSSWR